MSEREVNYTIGVDLGTTHCAVAAVDHDLSEGEEIALEVLRVPQSVAPGEVEARDLLPSFLYLPHDQELPAGSTALPWNPTPAHLVGELARRLGAGSPTRLVSSAKSWLSHPGVDRRGAILPLLRASSQMSFQMLREIGPQVARVATPRFAHGIEHGRGLGEDEPEDLPHARCHIPPHPLDRCDYGFASLPRHLERVRREQDPPPECVAQPESLMFRKRQRVEPDAQDVRPGVARCGYPVFRHEGSSTILKLTFARTLRWLFSRRWR